MIEEEINEYFDCGCLCSILRLNYDFGMDSLDTNISMYYVGEHSAPLRQKLRQIWNIIKTGAPYSDQFLLEGKDVNKLIEFLKKVKKLNKMKGEQHV